MIEQRVVLRSINDSGASRCVDIFRRADGSFGFEEYRRDTEDQRGWFPIGGFGERRFESEERALEEARSRVAWLNETEEPDGPAAPS